MSRTPTPPGMHGAKRRRARSEFGVQLREKQKVKQSYGMRERQFRKYFEIAAGSKQLTTSALSSLLETRLDNVVFRLGLAGSRSQARQTVGHGHFTVNGRRVDIPSYHVKQGDMIAIRSGSEQKKVFQDVRTIVKKYDPPAWLALDKEHLTGKVLHMPVPDEMDVPFNLQLVTEFYSK